VASPSSPLLLLIAYASWLVGEVSVCKRQEFEQAMFYIPCLTCSIPNFRGTNCYDGFSGSISAFNASSGEYSELYLRN
jgi:hypothetical protein